MDANYSGLTPRPYSAKDDIIARTRSDKRRLDYAQGALIPQAIALDNAQGLKEFPFSGDVIYLDRRSTGKIRFRFDMAWPAAFPLGANDAIKGIPFKSLLLEWDAQPGLVVYLWTGYGVEIIPSVGAISTIGSITNPVDISDRAARALGVVASITNPVTVQGTVTANGADNLDTLSSAYMASLAVSANVPNTIWSVGTNVNGIRVQRHGYFSYSAPGGQIGMSVTHKVSVPATWTDGNFFGLVSRRQYMRNIAASNTNDWGTSMEMERPYKIPAGYGGWVTSDSAVTLVGFTNYVVL